MFHKYVFHKYCKFLFYLYANLGLFIFSTMPLSSEVLGENTANPVTLQGELDKSLMNNKRIKAEISRFNAAKYRFEQATRRVFPTISANASYGFQHSKIAALAYETYPEKRYGITLNQDIYTGGRITAASEKARYDMIAEMINVDIVKHTQALEFIEIYITLYRNIKTQNLIRKNITVLEELVNMSKAQFKSGEATKVDIIQSEAELMTQQANLQKTIAESKGLQEKYRNLTGDDSIPQLSNPLSICHITDNKETVLAGVKKYNPEIRKAQSIIDSSNQDVELAKADLAPTISLSARSEYFKGDSAFLRDEAQTSAAVIQVNIPIFDRGMEYSRIKEAKATKQSTEYDLLDIRNRVLNDFENDYSLYQSQKDVINANKKSVQAMRYLFAKALREQALGFKSFYELLEIKQKMTEAKMDLLNSKTENAFYGCKILAMQGFLPIINPVSKVNAKG